MMRIGIQGGPGSFNDEAAQTKLPGILDGEFEIVYLYTTASVLAALANGHTDRGQFAIRNTLAGEVDESKKAIDDARNSAGISFEVVTEYSLQIRHALLVAPDADYAAIDTIMGHPHALTQCRTTLARRFANMRLRIGKDNLTDPAAIAGAIACHELPATTAVLGSAGLADRWGLQIVERDLQDSPDNVTTFVLVKVSGAE